MSRLILVPQYPTPMRYQQWWAKVFPEQFSKYFDKVITLGVPDPSVFSALPESSGMPGSVFAPMENAMEFEARQIAQYADLVLKPDDVLLLCDLSYPGLFANALFHKRPKKCFAICHATSKNRYDYFLHERGLKWPIETKQAALFDTVFVASHYHRLKLGWRNTAVAPFPNPPFPSELPLLLFPMKTRAMINVSRPGLQKRNMKFEKEVCQYLGLKVETPFAMASWSAYYQYLAESKVLLITAKEETYGYQIVDAVRNGCIPVAPRAFSYPELLPNEYLYDSLEECVKIIVGALTDKVPVPQLLTEILAERFYEDVAHIMIYE